MGCMKGKSCLANLISFYKRIIHLEGEGQAAVVLYPNLSKAFDTVSYSIYLEKLAAYGWLGEELAGQLGPENISYNRIKKHNSESRAAGFQATANENLPKCNSYEHKNKEVTYLLRASGT